MWKGLKMWKRIQIKPNDQSLVGRTIRGMGSSLVVLYVGSHKVFGKYKDGDEDIQTIYQNWEIWEEEKQKKLLAPVLLRSDKSIRLSYYLFSSIEEAKEYYKGHFISWPAIPNKDGYYEVDSE